MTARRRLSTCGFTHSDNREGETFDCQKCGYENHADDNAAKNIGLRYLRRNQTGGGEDAPLGLRLNSEGPQVPRTMRTAKP
jgi:putative transposase